MKQVSLITLLCLTFLLPHSSLKAQSILFTEDWSSSSFTSNGWSFPSGQANWGFTGSSSSSMISPTCSSAPSAFFTGNPGLAAYSNELVTPIINATAFLSSNLFISYNLKLIVNSSTSLEQFAIEYKTVSSPTWFTLANYSNSGGDFETTPKHLLLPGMAGTNFQIRFRPYGVNSTSISDWILDDIEISGAPNCTGTPSAGNTMTCTSLPLCPGKCLTLYLQNYLGFGSNMTFTWQRSISPTGPWVNIGATTNPSIVTCPVAGSTMYYRCVVTCSSSGLSDTSVPLTVPILSWSPTSTCYCTSSALYSQDEEIYNVTINGSSTDPNYSNLNGCTNVAPGPSSVLSQYSSFLSLPPITNLIQGTSVPLSIDQNECDGAPYFANSIGVWIDFNHNLSFTDPGELVYMDPVSAIGPRTINANFTVPITSILGNTIMRIVCTEGATPNPCGTYGYGETEDYLVNILPTTPCSTGPIPGNTLTSIASPTCTTPFTLSLQNTFSTSGILYQWYNTAGLISGATSNTYSTTLIHSDSFYCKVSCLYTGTFGLSTPIYIPITGANTGSSYEVDCSSFFWNGNTYTASGIYSGTFTNSAGCDSVHTINLTLNSTSPSNLYQTSCDLYVWPLTSTTYGSSGQYIATYMNAAGCDSNTVLNLTINNSSFNFYSGNGCDSLTYNGVTYTLSGSYTQNFTNSVGCDSTIFIVANINQSSASTNVNLSGCDSVSYNGQTYLANGIYNQTYTNSVGCDSNFIIQVNLNSSSITNINLNGCDSVNYNGQTFTSSGNYINNYTNSVGCDSIELIQAIIHLSTHDTVNTTVCDSILFGGIIYTTSGTYTAAFTNINGCDSTVTLNTTIDSSSNMTINQTGCDSITYNGQTYTLSGVYTGTYSTASGCDSIITLNILLNYINLLTSVSGDTIICNAPGLVYQWIDCITNTIIPGATSQTYLATTSGSYAVIVDGGGGCFDTSACTTLTNVGLNDMTGTSRDMIYPNPSNGEFSIYLEDEAILTLSNSIGEIIFKKEYKKGNHKIQSGEVANGIYLLHIDRRNSTEVIKVRIQH